MADNTQAAAAANSGLLDGLLVATAGGDRRAFQALYQQTSPRLYAVALRLLRRRDWAEDVLQETYIRIWSKAKLYDSSLGNPSGWLLTILRRCAFDRLREMQRAGPLAEPAALPEELPAPLSADDDPRSPTEAASIRDCVDRLELKQRRAILLAYYYGLTHEELSSHLDSPLGTVKSWIRRGLQRLKECLER
jgi:RNA polymerase sigma-70 factor (ECF subfamily)